MVKTEAAKSIPPILEWLRLVYAGESAGGNGLAQPTLAVQWLEDDPGLLGQDPYLGCAVGNTDILKRALAADPGWVNRAGGPLSMPPLVAVTHSSLSRLPPWQQQMLDCARWLLAQGADPNQSIGALTALYGAVGQNSNLEMTRLLLAAGADPDDGECLYHSLPNTAITRLLLEAGVPIGPNNALYHAFDFADPTPLMVLLQFGADANQPALGPPTSWFGTPLLWAIRRRVSMAHYEALLSAGADLRAHTPAGISAFQLARRYGLPQVAQLLVRWGAADDPGPVPERFLGACGCEREAEARELLRQAPDLIGSLAATDLALLPELIAAGAQAAARLMVSLGWPLDAHGGDWNATALNMAVLQGDVALSRFLLEHGASWTETHGYGSNVCGTLSWACQNRPAPQGDWPGCAQLLLEYGMPSDGQNLRFTEEVIQVLLSH